MKLGISDYDKLNENTFGAEPKTWIKYNGLKYLVKFPKFTKEFPTDSVKSEHLASSFINLAGGRAHKTIYIEEFEREDGTVSEAVLCRDILSDNGYDSMVTFAESTSSISTDIDRHEYFISEILHIFEKIHNMDFRLVSRDFWEMVLFDAILGNNDRHPGNWSIVKKGNERSLSPIYDNGACLFPRAMREFGEDRRNWLIVRTLLFPNSKIMWDDPEKKKSRMSYIGLVNSNIVPEYILNEFRQMDIESVLDQLRKENDWLSEKDWEFYYTVIKIRFLVIICGLDFDTAYQELEREKTPTINWGF